MEAIKLCRLDTPIIFIEARINLSRFVVTGCAAKTSATVTFPSLNLISLFAFCFNIWLNGVASDQVYAQNEMLAYQQKESTARVASIMENTNLSKQQQVSEIMRQMLTQAQTAGQYFTNDQIKEMTRKVSAEVDLVH